MNCSEALTDDCGLWSSLNNTEVHSSFTRRPVKERDKKTKTSVQ